MAEKKKFTVKDLALLEKEIKISRRTVKELALRNAQLERNYKESKFKEELLSKKLKELSNKAVKIDNKPVYDIEYIKDKILLYRVKKDGTRLKPYTFKYDKDAKLLTNLNKNKSANEKTILEYFKRKSKEKYVPTSEEEFKEQIKTIKKDEFSSKAIFPKSVIEFTSKKKTSNKYIYTYVVATVKIFLDGAVTYAKGRSTPFYYKDTEITNKNDGKTRKYKANPKGIPGSKLNSAIEQAVIHAIAPFGSNVKYEIINWQYAYYYKV